MNKRLTLCMFSTLALLIVLPQRSAHAQIARNDRAFLKQAWGLARFQEEASRLAASHAGGTDVKASAASLLKRHDEGGLAPLARARGITPPLMDGANRKVLNRLSRAKGAAFDKLYVQEVAIKVQREEAALLEQMAVSAQDAAIRQWARGMLPALRGQLMPKPGG